MVFSILFGHIVELCSNVWSNYVLLFSIMFGSLDWLPKFCLAGNYVGRFLDLWFYYSYRILFGSMEFCSALWNVRQVGWSLARRNVRAVMGQVHFPALFMISKFRNYSPDYSLNCTPLGPITITNQPELIYPEYNHRTSKKLKRSW